MELVVADSSFYISELRAKRQPFLEMEALGDAVEWATTGMVVLEVCRGLTVPRIRDEFLARYAAMVYLPTANRIWEHATRLAWELDRKGRTIPAQDILIAAHCLRHGARILTCDGHFENIPGLKRARSLDDLRGRGK
jgi:predicted nucleic acid-binding protein